MSRQLGVGAAVLVALALISIYSAMFFVHQSQNAVVVRFGRLIETVKDQPGLHWRVPYVDNVIYIDKRIINIDAKSIELLTQDQKRVVISAYVRYRITDPEIFYTVGRTTERAEAQISSVLNEVLRDKIGSIRLADILTEQRAHLMSDVTKRLAITGEHYGVQVVDVRFKRVDLPKENSEAVYNRMRTQRGQEARGIRAEGERKARELKAEADKQRVVLISEARRQAEILRGEGDAEATRIYNEAYGKDAAFFDFYRSLQAMQTGLTGDRTTFVGSPKGDFFRYFESGKTTGAPGSGGTDSGNNEDTIQPEQ